MNRTFYVAGVQFRPAAEVREVMSYIHEGSYLDLKPEPENKYDPNAIKIVFVEYDTDDLHLGYVPKKFSAEVAALLEAGIDLVCIVLEANPNAKPWEMLKVAVKIAEPEASEEEVSE